MGDVYMALWIALRTAVKTQVAAASGGSPLALLDKTPKGLGAFFSKVTLNSIGMSCELKTRLSIHF